MSFQANSRAVGRGFVELKLAPPQPIFGASLLLLSGLVSWLTGLWLVIGFGLAIVFWYRRPQLTGLEAGLLALAATLALSLVSAGIGGAEIGRLLAAAFNIAVIFCAVGAVKAGSALSAQDWRAPVLRKTIGLLFVVTLAMIIGGFVASKFIGRPQIEFPSLIFGQVQGRLPGILEFYQKTRLTGIDWRPTGPVARPVGIGIYYTEGALVFGMLGAVASSIQRTLRWRLVLLVGTILGLTLMASRTVLLAFSLLTLFSWYLQCRISTSLKALGVIAFALGLGVLALADLGLLAEAADKLLSARQASSAARLNSYVTGIELTLEQNPLFGLGVKPRDMVIMGIPIGSHSTFVSIFTKGGLVSLVVLLCVYLLAWKRVALAAVASAFALDPADRRLMGGLAVAGGLFLTWMFTEDFDAPVYGAMFGFMILGAAGAAAASLQRLESK